MKPVDLFTPQEVAALAERREAIVRHLWDTWGWPGPSAGALCEVDIPIPDTPEGPGLYCYGEQARLIELQPGGMWLAEIAMGDGWFKDGRRVLLERHYIGPPRRALRAAA